MGVTSREFWLMAYLLLGVFFFICGMTGFISKSILRVRMLMNGTWCMAITSWATVLSASPRFYLSAGIDPTHWRRFEMSWIAPILATTIAVIVLRYGSQLYRETKVRRALTVLFIIAFLAALVAGGSDILIGKGVGL